MPITPQTERQRRLWILDAIERGVVVKKIGDTVYSLDGKSVNIQSRKLNGTRSWFNLGDREYLPTLDYFVYICGSHEKFYNIPRLEMFRLAKVTTENSTDKRPQFHINVRGHEYLTGKEVLPIDKYYQNWEFY